MSEFVRDFVAIWAESQREAVWPVVCVIVPETGPRSQILAESYAAFRLQSGAVESSTWLDLWMRLAAQRSWLWFFEQQDRRPDDGFLLQTAYQVLEGERGAWQEAEDVVSDVKGDLVLHGLAPQHSIVSYLGTAIRNRALSRIRKERTQGEIKVYRETLDPDVHFWVADGSPPVSLLSELRERDEQIADAVAALPAPFRDVVLLYYFANGKQLTYDDIGQRLHITGEAVKKRLKKAKDLLRKELRDLRE